MLVSTLLKKQISFYLDANILAGSGDESNEANYVKIKQSQILLSGVISA